MPAKSRPTKLSHAAGSAAAETLTKPRVGLHRSATDQRVSSGRRAEKLASQVAARIERQVIKMGWPEGKVLGREPDLIQKHQVSRQVMREAIRLLEFHGVAHMRRGPAGGLVVSRPDSDNLARSVALFLEHARVTHEQILSLRMLLELHCVDRVIDSLDDAGVQAIRAAAADESKRRPTDPFQEYGKLHRLLPELARDPALVLFIHILRVLSTERMSDEQHAQFFARHHKHYCRELEAIADAIVARDKGAARAHMRTHLQRIDQLFR